MAKNKFNLASFLSGLDPKMTAELLQGANYFSDTSGMEKYLRKPSKTEKTLTNRLKTLKTDEQIAAEQKAAFDSVRNVANQAIQSAPNVASALTGGLGAAMGGLSSFAGSNIGALGSIASAGMSAEAPTMVASNDIRNIGLAGITQAGLQEQLGVQSAKTSREDTRTSTQDLLAQIGDTRNESLMALKGDKRTNLLKYISALMALRPADTRGGAGTAAAPVVVNPQDEMQIKEAQILKWLQNTGAKGGGFGVVGQGGLGSEGAAAHSRR
jgi:hypothetical protein